MMVKFKFANPNKRRDLAGCVKQYYENSMCSGIVTSFSPLEQRRDVDLETPRYHPDEKKACPVEGGICPREDSSLRLHGSV